MDYFPEFCFSFLLFGHFSCVSYHMYYGARTRKPGDIPEFLPGDLVFLALASTGSVAVQVEEKEGLFCERD